MRTLILLFSFMVLISSCSKDDDNSVTHTLKLQVESQGDFKVWWNYTNNPDANADWLAAPTQLFNQSFVREATITVNSSGTQGFYELKVQPVNGTEYTAKVFVDGQVVKEKMTSDYTFFQGHF